MKFVPMDVDYTFDTNNGKFNTLVIEEQGLFRRLISDISNQLQGMDGSSILTVGGELTPLSRSAALLDVFVPFDLNRKTLLTKIVAELEKSASDAANFENTGRILRDVELWLDRLAFDFPCDIVFKNVSVPALIKACSPEIRSASESLPDKVLDYIELLYEFDKQRLLFTLNLRSYVTDDEMTAFAADCISHGWHVIAIESSVHPLIDNENRVIVDKDLCLIYD